MSCLKKLLMSVACVSFVLGSTVVIAAEESSEDDSKNEFSSKIASGESVVLYKIHDVKALKSDDGDTSECEFSLTLYNRSPKTVETATIKLSWLDDGIADVIDKETKMDLEEVKPVNEKLAEMQDQAKPKTENFVSKDLTTSIILSKIKPFRQITLKSKIKSDRCFLMLGDVKASFPVCSVTESEASDSEKSSGVVSPASNDCDSLFRFVSSKDPEFYREFQKVSFNEEADRREEERKKLIDEVEMQYNKILQDANNISSVLESIK